MFHDLDTTLKELLAKELPPSLVEQISITFATPSGDFPPTSVTLPAIDLFLYEISENHEVRTFASDVDRRSDGGADRVPAVSRIDCHYLVSAWANTSVQEPDQDEHRILGEVMRVLLRFRQIPMAALRGSLTSQPYPPRARVSPPSPQQTRGDFWQALGGKPRAAFHYLVTIAMDVHATEDAGLLTQVVGDQS